MTSELQHPSLDAEELLHLAIVDSRGGRHDEAIKKLKAILSEDPSSSKAHFLLAAEHAEIGLHERAVEEMRTAVQLEPSWPIAHFQLGLLYFTQGRINEARAAWSKLDDLRDAGPLAVFRDGLIYVAEGRLQDAIVKLDEGIAANDSNPALNRDMSRLSETLRAQVTKSGETSPSSESSGRLFLNTYTEQSEKP